MNNRPTRKTWLLTALAAALALAPTAQAEQAEAPVLSPAVAAKCGLSVGNCTGGYCGTNLAAACKGYCDTNVAGYCSGECGINVAAYCDAHCRINVLSTCTGGDRCPVKAGGKCIAAAFLLPLTTAGAAASDAASSFTLNGCISRSVVTMDVCAGAGVHSCYGTYVQVRGLFICVEG